jgi:phenylpyruvate tautomerase PptA (4-oxalocrotonate tautomerase family)
MPIKEAVIHVYAFERTLEERRAMAAELTAAACRAYKIAPDTVTVYFFEHGDADVGYAGKLARDLRGDRKP